MSIVSATVTSIALGLCLVVAARIAPVALRVIRFDRPDRERDTLMVSWGLMWAAVVPLLTLRVYRLFVNNHQIYQDWWGMDILIALVAVSAALMLVVDASFRRRDASTTRGQIKAGDPPHDKGVD